MLFFSQSADAFFSQSSGSFFSKLLLFFLEMVELK